MFKKLSAKLLGSKVSVEDRQPVEVVLAIPREDEEIQERDYDEEREYAESREDAREFDEARRDSERVAESLEDFRNALAILNDKGGVTQESFVYAQVAAQAFESKLGVGLLDASEISFEGLEVGARVKLSLEQLDFAIEHLKNVSKIATEQFEAAAERVKSNAPSLENFALVEEIRDARSLESLIDHHNNLVDDQTSLEELRDLLAISNEQGGVSFESLVLINYALEQLVANNGVEAPYLTESLESLNQDERHQVSLENVDIALEGLLGSLRSGAEKIKKGLKKAFAMFKEKLGSVSANEELTVDRIKKCLESFEGTDFKASGKEIPAKLARNFSTSGEVPKDIPGVLEDLIETYDRCFTTIEPEILSIARGNAEAIHEVLKVSEVLDDEGLEDQKLGEAVSTLGKKLKSFKAPLKDLKVKDLPGFGNIIGPRDERTRVEGDFIYSAFDRLADECDEISLVNVFRTNIKVSTDAPAQDPAKCLESLKSTLKIIEKHSFVRDRQKLYKKVDEIEKLNWSMWDYEEYAFGKVFRSEAKLTLDLVYQFSDVWELGMTVRGCLHDCAESMIKVVKLSAEKVSTESIEEEVSMEASVKELKSGAKVKFSHGHGKIKKIFTSEFKIGGKHHKASKDDPRYLVAADKGGHLSIHKASALTLV